MPTLALTSGRRGNRVSLEASNSSTALDAVISLFWLLPTDFGDFLLEGWECLIASSSGAYVAVTPVPCIYCRVVAPDGTTNSEIVGREELMRFGANIDSVAMSNIFTVPILVRKGDRLQFLGPVLAGGGVTATVVGRFRGQRLLSS